MNRRISISRAGLLFSITATLSVTVATPASAVSLLVQRACMSDYYSFCSQHAVGSSSLRRCMSSNGSRLSQRCVNALVAAGEVSKTEVERRSASSRR